MHPRIMKSSKKITSPNELKLKIGLHDSILRKLRNFATKQMNGNHRIPTILFI